MKPILTYPFKTWWSHGLCKNWIVNKGRSSHISIQSVEKWYLDYHNLHTVRQSGFRVEVSHYYSDLGEYSITGNAITNLPIYPFTLANVTSSLQISSSDQDILFSSLALNWITSSLRFHFSVSHANYHCGGEWHRSIIYSVVLFYSSL